MAGLIMFIAALLMLGIGFPVAFTFGAVSMKFSKICLTSCHIEFFLSWRVEFL